MSLSPACSLCRAQRLIGCYSEYDIQEIPVPKPKGYEVLIKVGAAGFCHTVSLICTWAIQYPDLPPICLNLCVTLLTLVYCRMLWYTRVNLRAWVALVLLL